MLSKLNQGMPEESIESEAIMVGQNNVCTPQETQDFLRNSEMGKILGVAHLFETTSTDEEETQVSQRS